MSGPEKSKKERDDFDDMEVDEEKSLTKEERELRFAFLSVFITSQTTPQFSPPSHRICFTMYSDYVCSQYVKW